MEAPDRTVAEGVLSSQTMVDALKAVWRSRGFAVLTVLVTALTVAGATTLLQTVDAAFRRPLPYPHAERMVMVVPFAVAEGRRFGRLPGEFVQALDGLIEAPTSVLQAKLLLSVRPDRSEVWEGAMVTTHAPRLFGLTPVAGRLLTDADFQTTDGPLPAMIEEGLWRRAFGGATESLGQVIAGDPHDVQIVGIYRAGFVLPSFAKPLVPAFIAPDREVTTEWMLGPMGRLRPGITPEEAQRTIAARVEAVHARHAPIRQVRADVVPLRAYLFEQDGTFIRLIAGAAVALLLGGTLSLAVLHIARLQRRLPEMAVRLSLGDTPARLRRRWLAQGLLTALGAVPFAVVLSLGLMVWLDPGGTMDAGLAMLASETHGRVALLAVIVALVVSTAAVGLAVAIGLRRRVVGRLRLVETLRGQGTTAGQVALVATQAALATVLLVVATVALRTSASMAQESTGVTADDLYFVAPRLPRARFQSAARGELWHAMVREIASDPRIKSAAVGLQVPLSGDAPWASIQGRDGADYLQRGGVIPMSREFLATVGATLVAGRIPTAEEDAAGEMVAVINEHGARAYFGSASPLGQYVHTPWFAAPYRVIGVVSDIRFSDAVPTIPMLYVPMWQQRLLTMTVAVRTTLPREQAQEVVEAAVRRIDPAAALPALEPFNERLRHWRARPLFFTRVFTVGGAVALLLTALSTIAIVRTVVAGRQRELGIRLALGEPIAVAVRRLLRAIATAAFIGAGVGAAAGGYGGQVARTQISRLETLDARSYLGPASLVIALLLVTTYVVCRRAVANTPLDVLKRVSRF